MDGFVKFCSDCSKAHGKLKNEKARMELEKIYSKYGACPATANIGSIPSTPVLSLPGMI